VKKVNLTIYISETDLIDIKRAAGMQRRSVSNYCAGVIRDAVIASGVAYPHAAPRAPMIGSDDEPKDGGWHE
jgi:hypothetical protein